MEQEESKSNEVAANGNERLVLQSMEKTEIIKKCINLKSALDRAKREIEIYRSLLLKSSEEYNLLKSKNPDILQTEYNKKWSWINKIVFVLKKINRPLRSAEIIAFIIPYEPVLQYSHHKAQAFSNLNKAVKYCRVRAYKLAGSRGYYYVLPNWLDDKGQLTKEYENKIFFK